MTDIVVIGGGASGLTAAIYAKKYAPEAKIMIAEKLQRTGKKIIAAGNGKCNLSNIDLSDQHYHGTVDAMRIICSMPDYKKYFTDELGVICTLGSEGRTGGVYPRSNSSATVLSALRLKLKRLGVEERCDCEIRAIKPVKGGFILSAKDEEIRCRKVIVAAGGYAGPSFGTDGSMLRVLKEMGYTVGKICPAVAPLKVSPEDVKGLKGVRVKGTVSAVSGGKILRTENGELQFNENNISGICVFNLAYLYQRYEGRLKLRMDLYPEAEKAELTEYLNIIKKQRRDLPAEELLTGLFVRNLAVYIMKKASADKNARTISQLTGNETAKAAELIKSLEINVIGCSGWQNAQVTMGGIESSCIDDELQSKLHRGMYFCGEILDTAGDCGGYNLQFAWSSGMLAGMRCGESLKGGKNDQSK